MLNVKELVECVYMEEDIHFEVVNWAVENNLVERDIVDNFSIEKIEEFSNEILSTIGYKIVDEPQGDFSLTEGLCILREI